MSKFTKSGLTITTILLVLGGFQNCSSQLPSDAQNWSGASTSPVPSAASKGVVVNPSIMSLNAGDSLTFISSNGTAPYLYSVDLPNLATINSSSGALQAIAAGQVTVTVMDAEGLTGVATVNIAGASPTPVVTPPTAVQVPIYRSSHSGSFIAHLFSLDPNAGPNAGYTAEGIAFYVFQTQQPNTTALFSCGYPGGSIFLSTSANCEGQTKYGTLGYVFGTAQPANATALYRMVWYAGQTIYNDFLTTTVSNEGAPAYHYSGIVGYAPTNH